MSDLPPELLEIVFTCLPLATLLGTCTLVCSTWRDIIANPKFIRRRKIYYKTKLGAAEQFLENEVTPETNEGKSVNRVVALLTYCHNEYEKKQHLFSEIVRSKRHEEGLAQLKQVTENMSPANIPPVCPVVVTTWLILTSSSVWDLRNIVRCLLSSSSCATTADISEYLYTLAWRLLVLCQAGGSVRHYSRLHFLVFHALYFIENEWSVTPTNQSSGPRQNPVKKTTGQQSLMSFGFAKSIPSKIPTAEQLRIIHHPLGSNKSDLIKIVAFAGTGKTTTLVKLTENNPNLKFLLVVYNKSVRIQAESQFPKANVTCKTVHQMAMDKCG